jgi:hypothetical protein
VDSHPTIGNGVVVQVTGELSNNGDPMRRFMQTFVLAPRQPKKYYVQNDIFRYQDEVFDDGSDEDDRSSSQIYGDTVTKKIQSNNLSLKKKTLFRIRFQMLIHQLQLHNNHYWSPQHHDQQPRNNNLYLLVILVISNKLFQLNLFDNKNLQCKLKKKITN